MNEKMIRLSFDIPIDEHIMLKTECAMAQVTIKDFMHELVIKGIRELRERQLKKRLKKSIQQSKEGKVRSRGSFAKYVEDEV